MRAANIDELRWRRDNDLSTYTPFCAMIMRHNYRKKGVFSMGNTSEEHKKKHICLALYDEVCNTDIEKSKEYEAQCLDIWDLMFENRVGITRDLTEKLTEM